MTKKKEKKNEKKKWKKKMKKKMEKKWKNIFFLNILMVKNNGKSLPKKKSTPFGWLGGGA